MKIAVIGSAGSLGSRIVAEALRRGHDVTALTRTDLDAADADAVTTAVRGHDVGIGATRPAPGQEHHAATTTRSLLQGHAAAGVRFVMIGGAGALRTPDTGELVADDRRWVPQQIAALARSAVDQLDECRMATGTDWTYVAPSAVMEPGQRTGHYRTGVDKLLVDEGGNSYVSMEDMAVAVVDELADPSFRGQRFTVATATN
ncbi:NAD(P)-dependent oxidoreductase [Tomitella cavernea]|uniref:NAD(P)H-binding protein n=1 Tax=Tomitella cavernea TaxID=1387982 RepID=A0ABP9CUW0_9ACTN|nr:NAD(P)H-binding protein [Tomitella cavernea]